MVEIEKTWQTIHFTAKRKGYNPQSVYIDDVLCWQDDDEHTWNLETVTNFKPLPQPLQK